MTRALPARPLPEPRVRRVVAAVAALLVGLVAAVSLPAPARAAGVVPDAPTITTISGGLVSGQLLVGYVPPANDGGSSIVRYEVTLDAGVSWFPCAGMDGVCPLLSLHDGTPYWVRMRAVNANGPGAVSAPVAGTPSMPPNADPDKPGALPAKRVNVKASLDPASNGLGVDGTTTVLGVGTLPRIRFNVDIPDKAAAERHLFVSATDATGKSHQVKGAWGWVSERSAVFRPQKFWPGRSTINITSTLDGTMLGIDKAGAALIGVKKLAKTWTFRTGRALVLKIDGSKHRARAVVDGKLKKTLKVSLGQSEWETRNGIKVVSTDKLADKVYTSEALGITDPNEQYRLEAKWNTRLTPTGEFIHAAPWAYGRIGRFNGSHGCTNMFEQDAKWVYDNTIPGDPVVYTNTAGSVMESWNGPGGLWNVPWASWLKKSALASGTSTPDTSNPLDRSAAGPVKQASA